MIFIDIKFYRHDLYDNSYKSNDEFCYMNIQYRLTIIDMMLN